jgi:electron transport complex protein RnfG
MKAWNSLKPVLVLVLICLVTGGALAAVNQVTSPVIAVNEERSRNATYFAVLPEADSFTQLDCDLDGVTAVLQADNGAGYVITAQSRGYGGEVPAAVSFDADGNILRVLMTSNDETPGLGQKVTEESFYGQFSGLPAQTLTIDDIDAVTGATISSKAAVSAIDLAIEAYHAVLEGGS